MVLLFNSKLRLFPRKLNSKWSDSFLIKEVKLCCNVKLEDLGAGRTWIVNGQILKPYLGGDIERLTTMAYLSYPWRSCDASS